MGVVIEIYVKYRTPGVELRLPWLIWLAPPRGVL
jgi:hypothetical protein